MIRTSNHTFHEPNKQKHNNLKLFCSNYKIAVNYFVDYLWNNPITYNNKIFDVKQDLLDCPSMISTVNHNILNLSQRVIKCAATQACGIIKATLEKRRKRLYILNKLKQEGKTAVKLEEKLKIKPSKPEYTKEHCEINSICCDLKFENNFVVVQLKSLGEISKIRLPFKFHKQARKWQSKGQLLSSILISPNFINLRWEIKNPKLKDKGKEIGCDPGKTTCWSLSDGKTSLCNKDNYDLNSIQAILARRKKGSKGFKRGQNHRKNYINWSINQMNLRDIKQINYEENKNIRFGKNSGRHMSHWTYTLINSKVTRFCEESGVRLKLQSSPYRSQRCSQCGLVNKENRKGKIFCCVGCEYADDADLNSAKNNNIHLPDLYFLRHLGYNILGFYWKESGIYDLDGKEFTVLCTKEKI